jgi:hypothetical protein
MAQAAPQSLFTAGLDGCSFEEQVAMVRQRADLEHQRLSEGADEIRLRACCAGWRSVAWHGISHLAWV